MTATLWTGAMMMEGGVCLMLRDEKWNRDEEVGWITYDAGVNTELVCGDSFGVQSVSLQN